MSDDRSANLTPNLTLQLADRQLTEYRLQVVMIWPTSVYKAATVAAIRARLTDMERRS